MRTEFDANLALSATPASWTTPSRNTRKTQRPSLRAAFAMWVSVCLASLPAAAYIAAQSAAQWGAA